MALDAEDFDFQGLGNKLTNTILDSFNEALGKIKLSSVSTSLVDAFKDVKMSKVIEDSLTKNSEVKKSMQDIQKKLEDNFNKIKFKVGDIVIPDLPEQIIKVTADTTNFKLQKQKPIDVPVNYKYNNFKLPTTPKIDVPVIYQYDKFEDPKVEAIDVPVHFSYDKLLLPKVGKLQVGIKYAYDKLVLPKASDTVSKVKFAIDKLVLPKAPSIMVAVKYLYDKFTLPKQQDVPVKLMPDTTKLSTGLTEVVNKTKTAVNTIFGSKTISVNVDMSEAEQQLAATFKSTTIPITAVSQAAQVAQPTSTMDTGPLEKAGNLVRDFVALTQEANKKTTVTVDLYSKIVDLAQKIVASKRMEAGAVDEIVAIIGQKVDVPITVNASVGAVDVSAIDQVSNNPIEIEAKVATTTPGVATTAETPEYDLGNLGKATSMSSEILNLINKQGDRFGFSRKQIEFINKAFTGYVANLAKQNSLLSTADKIQQNLKDAQDDYNEAVKQAKADIRIKNLTIGLRLTEQETSELANQIRNNNLILRAKGKLTDQEKLELKLNGGLTNEQVKQIKNHNHRLRHLREERELVEHVANYQKEVNEELEKYSKGWNKIKATTSAIFKDPALAKGVLFASAIVGIEKLTESMDKFREIGMTAGEGVTATFKTMSVTSVMGLNKSDEVLSSLVQDYGSLNTLTKEQLTEVGYMAHEYGLAGKEAADLTMAVSRMSGQSKESAVHFGESVNHIGKMKGVLPSQVMKEMAKNTANMALYSKGGAEGFAKAAASAKKMGVELSTVLGAAEKTLDFESSINAQMEASVLLGRELNMDKLREAALSGDADAVLREQMNLIKQAGGLENMNLLQKQKVAAMMGLSVEDMTKMAASQHEANNLAEAHNTVLGRTKELMGSSLEIGGGIVKGFGSMMPVLMSITSLMSIMNSGGMLGGMVKGIYQFGKGLAIGVLQAGLLLLKMIALGVASAVGLGKPAKQMLFGDKGVGESVKGLFGKKEVSLPKKPELPGAEDKVSEVSDKASKSSDKTKTVQSGKGVKDFLTNLAAGLKAMGDVKVLFGAFNLIPASIGLIAMIPGLVGAKLMEKIDGKKVKESLVGLAKGIEAFGSGKITGGALNLIVASIGLTSMIPGALGAFAIQKLVNGEKIKESLKGLAKGIEAFASGKVFIGSVVMVVASAGLLVLAVASIPLLVVGYFGALIGAGLTALALGVASFGTGSVFKGALGLGLVGLSLIPAAYAFSLLAGVDYKSIAAFTISLIALTLATIPMAALVTSGVLGTAAIGFAILGASLIPFGIAAVIAGVGITLIASGMQKLTTVKTDALIGIGDGLLHIAKGLGAIGLSGILALPTLLALSKVGGLSTAPTGIASAPAPIPTAAIASTASTTTATTTKQEPSNDLDALVAEMRALVKVMKSGAVINMDGKVVAQVVQRNISTFKFDGK